MRAGAGSVSMACGRPVCMCVVDEIKLVPGVIYMRMEGAVVFVAGRGSNRFNRTDP